MSSLVANADGVRCVGKFRVCCFYSDCRFLNVVNFRYYCAEYVVFLFVAVLISGDFIVKNNIEMHLCAY